jgi:hypothetical protein
VLATLTKGIDELSIVAVALGQRGAAGEHDLGMTDVGPRKFHLVLL